MIEQQPEQDAEPKTQSSIERIREAVRLNPSKMTLQMALEHGVPEVEIIRGLPDERAVELDITRWEQLIPKLESAGAIRVLVSNGAATVEVMGQFGGFSKTGDYFNVQTKSLDMHIRWKELSAAFAVEKPGHLGGETTYSIQFFDRRGSAAFKVFLSFGEAIRLERHQLFQSLRDEFRISG